jgi:hypothetical protein
VTDWQTPKPSKAGGGGSESGGENGGGETGGGGVVNMTAAGITVDSWLDKYELGEYAEGIKGAGYNSMRFLKAACEEVRQRQDKTRHYKTRQDKRHTPRLPCFSSLCFSMVFWKFCAL